VDFGAFVKIVEKSAAPLESKVSRAFLAGVFHSLLSDTPTSGATPHAVLALLFPPVDRPPIPNPSQRRDPEAAISPPGWGVSYERGTPPEVDPSPLEAGPSFRNSLRTGEGGGGEKGGGGGEGGWEGGGGRGGHLRGKLEGPKSLDPHVSLVQPETLKPSILNP